MESTSTAALQGQIDALCEAVAALMGAVPPLAALRLAVHLTGQMEPMERRQDLTEREKSMLQTFGRLRAAADSASRGTA